MQLPCYRVADLPDAASKLGWVVCVLDGNVGSPCLAYSDGVHWLRLMAGLPVATA